MTGDGARHARLHQRQIGLLSRLGPTGERRRRELEESIHPGYRFPWRVAEAPALVPEALFARDVAALRAVLDPYFTPGFRAGYRDACPARWRRPDDAGWFPRFIATDFQRVFDPDRGFTWCCPEIQSFPGNVLLKPTMLRSLLPYVPGLREADLFRGSRFESFEDYVGFLRRHVLGGHRPEDTIILEIRPLEQKTVVDMLLFVKHLGVRLVDLRDVVVDPRTGEAGYRRATIFDHGVPRTVTFDRLLVAHNILSRCLPEEVEAALAAPDGGLDAATVAAVFEGTLARRTAEWVVHPQDFFVLCKATLVGNPAHHPPLRPLTRGLLAELDRQGVPVERGVLKLASSAGGRGLRGFHGGLGRAEVEGLLDAVERSEGAERGPAAAPAVLWQERYGADAFDRSRIDGYVPADDAEGGPVYHEIRLMWAAAPRPGGAPFEVDLTYLTGMTRWSRVGFPANAGYQKTPFTGTHGLLVEGD